MKFIDFIICSVTLTIIATSLLFNYYIKNCDSQIIDSNDNLICIIGEIE